MTEAVPMTEKWLPVLGYLGFYEVSDEGRVRSVNRTIRCKNNAVKHFQGRYMKLCTGKQGYQRIKLSKNGRYKTHLVHHLVLKAFVGQKPVNQECRHWNGIKTDNRLVNLSWAYHSVNQLDQVRHGTHYERSRVFCPWGHKLGAPNIVALYARRGHRNCLACARARANEQKAKSLNQDFDFQLVSDSHYARIISFASTGCG